MSLPGQAGPDSGAHLKQRSDPGVELLAPAKDLESGRAAIQCGADAVYVGAARFGARQAAGNSLQDIEKLAAYAHLYWAKLYATLNTLLRDDELEPAVRLAWQLYEAGADALIIQDAGLLECDLPPLPLFASTQMHNSNPERVAFLEKVGFQRAILARELSLDEIAEMRAATQIDLETFIHGALCVSYSGQCYLSYALGGRSGNRGQCAQPCRRSYSLVDRNGKTLLRERYLLSLKDLNLSDHLEDLLRAGVRSFKIEGRLKDKAYVMNVVGYYRRRLDELLPRLGLQPASSGQVRLDFEPNLAKTFNRGYSAYFIQERNPALASPDTPKHTGEALGRVSQVRKDCFVLEQAAGLNSGDGITYFDRSGELVGALVNRVEGRVVYPARLEGLQIGALVYRNHDHAFLQGLEKSRAERRIALRLRLSETPAGYRLEAQDQDGNLASVELQTEKVAAQKPEQARQIMERQLKRFGESEFTCPEADLEIDLAEIPFLPVGTLNSLRRELSEEMRAERQRRRPRPEGGPLVNTTPFPESELSFTGNVLNQKAEAFYRRHGVQQIKPAAESGLDLRGRRVMSLRYCIKYQLGRCPYAKNEASEAGLGEHIELQEPLFLVDEAGRRLRLRFNCRECRGSVSPGMRPSMEIELE